MSTRGADDAIEHHLVNTDSSSDIHKGASSTKGASIKEVCLIIDLNETQENYQHRKMAYEEVKLACQSIASNLQLVQFGKLDFGDTRTADIFHSADVAIVDLSLQHQQSALSYNLGLRESFEMKNNIVLFNDLDQEATLRLKISTSNYTFLPYRLSEEKNSCIITNPVKREGGEDNIDSSKQQTLYQKMKKILLDVEIQSKAHLKEKFLADLRAIRELSEIDDQKEKLRHLRKRLDDPNVLSGEVFQQYMYSLRDVQDYDAMVNLMNDLQTVPSTQKVMNTGQMSYLYAFALNRRNKTGDRDKALQTCVKALEKKQNHFPDMLCLCGRIYKDLFVESNYTDNESLQNAIHWYRKSFEVQPNEYAGINLATLLVIKGDSFGTSQELQHIAIILNSFIGRRGELSQLKDYWTVATFFEISVLAEDYTKASQAAECMFKLKPPNWYLKSTIGNIQLINQFREINENVAISPERKIFDFWVEFFLEAIKTEAGTDIRFPILVFEPQGSKSTSNNNVYLPSYVNVNMDVEEKSIQIINMCVNHEKDNCKKKHDFLFTADQIKSVSLYKRDERCAYLYVHQNSDDFQMFFPSVLCRQSFYDFILEMTKDGCDSFVRLDEEFTADDIKYEYEYDENKMRVVLGKGTFGSVFAARDINTQMRIAIKEVPEKIFDAVQPLHEEIKLHSQLRHKNIVTYYGSISENGYFKIFMEQVPGGSLSALLRSKWGPLKDNESTIAFYSKQILLGLKYLHDQKIVHRDIKGDNVLVNTYSGVIKISDFGTSKRLAGINPKAATFTGTVNFMAPEIIDQGARGYGPPADIWAFGCTNVEMATGKPPFIELGSQEAAMFKIGFYKKHPEIPEEMSTLAKKFILRCFTVDVDQRATAAQLLEDPFLSDKHRRSRTQMMPTSTTNNTGHVDFNRSYSVPADRLVSKSSNTVNHQQSVSACNTPTTPEFDSITTPSVDAVENDFNVSFRRSSTGVLLSPEVDVPSSTSKLPVGETNESDGFYLLKKDSQRRQTLSKVLSQDETKICEVWIEKIAHDRPEKIIDITHLEKLIRALRDYITDQKKEFLKKALNELKNELDFDPTAIDHLHYALYKFQDAVITVLRSVSIKPHWMFALDNLVKGAVHASLMILSPELGANLAGNERDFVDGDDDEVEDELSNSGISTVNSLKTKHHSIKDNYDKLLLEQVKVLKIENTKLINELLESHKSLQSLLKSSECGMDALKNVLQQYTSLTRSFERSASYGYFSDDQNLRKPSISTENSPTPEDNAEKSITNVNSRKLNSSPLFKNPTLKTPYRQCNDMKLIEWLSRNNFDEEAKHLIAFADFTYEDLMYFSDKDDIRRIGLRAGTEVRLWKLVNAHRKKFGTYHVELQRNMNDSLVNGFSNDAAASSYDSTSSATNSSYDSCE
ncbi:hypothetical protein PVAND_008335 [Polypedilum vanderplanki]|uniref:Protein kinase domain-containing protein n=1 Tax=Polypedilum vanderplanki TaxID=319348 RepID=A0A9J6C9V6_POLVA|nr:hypothetical protein PVAND_008335 [Polypedilum vanderplanki]